MATSTNNIDIVLKAKDLASKEIEKAKKGLDGLVKSAKKHNKTFKKMAKVGGVMAGSMAGITVALSKTAVQMDTLNRKSEIVFGEYIDDVRKMARESARSLGLTSREFEHSASSIQDLLVPMGFARGEATEMSTDLIKLSGALSQWTGGQKSATEISEILSKAMLGEVEQLKMLGIQIDQSSPAFNERIKQSALQKNITLQQAKALDIQNQILSKSTDAQNSFAKSGGTLIDKQARLQASLREVKQTLAEAIIPILADVSDKVTPIIIGFADWIRENEKLIKVGIPVVGTIGAIIGVVGILGAILPAVATGFHAVAIGMKAMPILAIAGAFVFLAKVIKDQWEGIKWMVKIGVENVRDNFEYLGVFINDWATNLIGRAKDWGANLIQNFIDGLTSSSVMSNLQANLNGVASNISDFLGFHSPTKRGPGSDADQWIPNLIDMMAQGLKLGEGQIEKASSALAGIYFDKITGSEAGQKWFSGRSRKGREFLDSRIDVGHGALSGQIASMLSQGKGYDVASSMLSPYNTGLASSGFSVGDISNLPDMGQTLNISIQMDSLTVFDEADENRLVDKIIEKLKETAKNFNKGIA